MLRSFSAALIGSSFRDVDVLLVKEVLTGRMPGVGGTSKVEDVGSVGVSELALGCLKMPNLRDFLWG
jgi:hypothetical protein